MREILLLKPCRSSRTATFVPPFQVGGRKLFINSSCPVSSLGRGPDDIQANFFWLFLISKTLDFPSRHSILHFFLFLLFSLTMVVNIYTWGVTSDVTFFFFFFNHATSYVKRKPVIWHSTTTTSWRLTYGGLFRFAASWDNCTAVEPHSFRQLWMGDNVGRSSDSFTAIIVMSNEAGSDLLFRFVLVLSFFTPESILAPLIKPAWA